MPSLVSSLGTSPWSAPSVRTWRTGSSKCSLCFPSIGNSLLRAIPKARLQKARLAPWDIMSGEKVGFSQTLCLPSSECLLCRSDSLEMARPRSLSWAPTAFLSPKGESGSPAYMAGSKECCAKVRGQHELTSTALCQFSCRADIQERVCTADTPSLAAKRSCTAGFLRCPTWRRTSHAARLVAAWILRQS